MSPDRTSDRMSRPIRRSTHSLMIIVLLIWPSVLLAQTPTTFNYQGRLLQNSPDQDAVTGSIDITFSIWSGPNTDGAATQLWSESWTGIGLSNGIFSVLLGSNGSPLEPADFQTDSSLYLQLEIDGEVLAPRQQLGSAPFAMVDEPGNELQDLELSGDQLSLTGSSATVDLSPYTADSDEQDLELLPGNTLSLTGDSTPVDLSVYLDNTDAQNLSLLADHSLSVSGSGSTVSLLPYLDNTDSQTLDLSGNTLTISGSGSSVNLDSVVPSGLADRVEVLERGLSRKVFVSSQTYNGNLGGLGGADAHCQALADAAGLSGTFRAWLSTTDLDVGSRFSRLGSFERVDGTAIAESWTDLTDGSLQMSILLDETGATPTGQTRVWTGTAIDGTTDVATCDDWSGASGQGVTGSSTADDNDWTRRSISNCTTALRLYCFEQPAQSSRDQELSLVGTELLLSSDDGLDSVDLAGLVAAADNQELSLSGDTLQLTSDDGTDTVNLLGYLDNTDEQALSLSGNTLSISGSGGSVEVAVPTDVASLDSRLDELEGAAIERQVFVSSRFYSPDFGGTAGADTECRQLAAAAGLDGIFMAWISDSAESPATRFDRRGYFVRTDGVRLADDWNDLTDGNLQNTISIDEDGDPIVGFIRTWTGTGTDGAPEGNTCSDWSITSPGSNAQIGATDLADSSWTSLGTRGCGGLARLFCFEQPAATATDLSCMDCVEGSEIEDATVGADHLAAIGVVNVKCDSGDCTGTAVGDMCDDWSAGSRPIAVSPAWEGGSISGAVICSDGHTCNTLTLTRSTALSQVCQPKVHGGWDCTITCIQG